MSGKIPRCVLVTVLLLIGVFASCVTEHCVDQTKVYIDPPTIARASAEDTTLDPGKRFTINVCIANVSDLSSYEFNMSYDTLTLTCIGVAVGPTDHVPTTNWKIEDYRGNLWVNVTYATPVTTNPAVTVASLTFLIQRRGESVLDPYYTNLIDSSGRPIPCVVSDGYFSNFNPYDLNKDGRVDLADVVIVTRAFGKKEGQPGWDPRADLKRDGVIDIFDCVLIARHYGET